MYYVGQKVVCVSIEESPRSSPGALPVAFEGLELQKEYTVCQSYLYDTGSGPIPVVQLVELRRCRIARIQHGENCGFGQWRFRPVVSTDISVFTAMLDNIPTREHEPA